LQQMLVRARTLWVNRVIPPHFVDVPCHPDCVAISDREISYWEIIPVRSAKDWVWTAESGNALTFIFVRYGAIGNFADPNFPAPTIAVWEESRHPWVSLPPDTPPTRVAKQG
jgi:hypothetical protein